MRFTTRSALRSCNAVPTDRTAPNSFAWHRRRRRPTCRDGRILVEQVGDVTVELDLAVRRIERPGNARVDVERRVDGVVGNVVEHDAGLGIGYVVRGREEARVDVSPLQNARKARLRTLRSMCASTRAERAQGCPQSRRHARRGRRSRPSGIVVQQATQVAQREPAVTDVSTSRLDDFVGPRR